VRVNPDSRADLLYALSETQRQQDKAMEQISSGRRISVPSDDPAAMAALIRNSSQSRANDEFSHSLATIKSVLQTTDSTLSSAVSGLQRAITLGVQGATGTQSQADRDAVASEVAGIRDNILSLANSSFNGKFLFSGSKTDTVPFAADSSSPSGISYQGNASAVDVPVGENRTMAINVPGDEIFMSPGGDVFQAMNDMLSALQAGDATGVSDATAALRSGFDQLSEQRAFVGNALSQVESNDTFLSGEKLNFSDQENQIAGADLAESISTLLNVQTARNATLAAAGKISQLSLLDYLT
jgi:flagellar hook-associated protein 3 FlgL